MKQRRYVSANLSKLFSNTQAFLRHMSTELNCTCDCDGRGCTICISADALEEAASLIDKLSAASPRPEGPQEGTK